MGKVERLAMNVGNAASRLLDHQHSRSMIPYFFTVVGTRRQPEINIGLSPRDDGVFCLAVQPDRRSINAEPFRQSGRIAVGAMARFHRLTKPSLANFLRVPFIISSIDINSGFVISRSVTPVTLLKLLSQRVIAIAYVSRVIYTM